jgi:hypothetical protein
MSWRKQVMLQCNHAVTAMAAGAFLNNADKQTQTDTKMGSAPLAAKTIRHNRCKSCPCKCIKSSNWTVCIGHQCTVLLLLRVSIRIDTPF